MDKFLAHFDFHFDGTKALCGAFSKIPKQIVSVKGVFFFTFNHYLVVQTQAQKGE